MDEIYALIGNNGFQQISDLENKINSGFQYFGVMLMPSYFYLK